MGLEPHQCWFAAILATLAGSICNTPVALRIGRRGGCFACEATCGIFVENSLGQGWWSDFKSVQWVGDI
jgi:hypothetical protein